MNLRKLFYKLMAGMVALAISQVAFAGGEYKVEFSTDGTEYKLKSDAFHFGTFVVTSENKLVFRPHPDRLDINGWGTSWFMAPFLPGSKSPAGIVSVDSITANQDGIHAIFHGEIANGQTGGYYGNWNAACVITYDNFAQKVTLSGSLGVAMNGMLDTDLNLGLLSTNFLYEVPLQTGGYGDTGDMKEAVATYGQPSPHTYAWNPGQQPRHYPTDASSSLGINVKGQINTVDTMQLGHDFQIAVAYKPTVNLTYSSNDAKLSAGFAWDSSKGQDFAADNVGINHLVLKNNTTASNMVFNFTMESHVEQPHPVIRANNTRKSLEISPGDMLSVAIDINGGTGQNADWWVLIATPWGDLYCYVYPNQWKNAGPDLNKISTFSQGALFNISDFEVLSIIGLPKGRYALLFGVDLNMNGSLDISNLLYYDFVQVNVK